jgi:hypothetical protein
MKKYSALNIISITTSSLLRIAFIFIIVTSFCYSQGVLKIETDKSSYAYSDSIQVRVIVSNNTDTSFSIWGNSTCIAAIAFNDVHFQITCTLDESEFKFPPHTSRTWLWELKPEVLGIPVKEGEQVIYGFCSGLVDSIMTTLVDSIKITAPRYYGGRLSVGFSSGILMQHLRDSLNVTVLNSDTLKALGKIIEDWQVSNYSIDSIVAIYKNDSRFQFIESDRPLSFIDEFVASVKQSTILPDQYRLSPNYPNPFNPSTTINYSLAKAGDVKLTVYNALGSKVATIVNEYKPAGNYSVKFNGNNLASGIYLYRLESGNYNAVKKLILMK